MLHCTFPFITHFCRCGVCVLGNTSNGEDKGKDACGECTDPNSGNELKKMECSWCGYKMDDCGQCRPKDDKNWNSKNF
jgi:hypothetical protein